MYFEIDDISPQPNHTNAPSCRFRAPSPQPPRRQRHEGAAEVVPPAKEAQLKWVDTQSAMFVESTEDAPEGATFPHTHLAICTVGCAQPQNPPRDAALGMIASLATDGVTAEEAARIHLLEMSAPRPQRML